MATVDPPLDCDLCPRLRDFLDIYRREEPSWFNGPVPNFGDAAGQLLIVGLAPGLKGANLTGRPFTGDFAGDLLYSTLEKFQLSNGQYGARKDDGLVLQNCQITNSVRCVPPKNKPVASEINTCRQFFDATIKSMQNLKVILALGRIAHETVLVNFGYKKSAYPFHHGALHQLPSGLILADTYHCSRYNTNTGRLTTEMFEAVFENIMMHLHPPSE